MLLVFENFWKENVYLSDKLKWKNEEERWVIRNIFVQGDWRGVGSPFMMQKLASNIKTYNHKSLYVKASQENGGVFRAFLPCYLFSCSYTQGSLAWMDHPHVKKLYLSMVL